MELEIIYQDEWLVAVNKPSGMLVHRSWLDSEETVFVMQTLRNQIGQHVFPLHRLDKPTSGVLLFALSSEIANQMQQQFVEHTIEKFYHALVRGWVKEAAVLDYPLVKERDKIANKHASEEKEYQSAITEYWPIAEIELPFAVSRYPTSRYGLVGLKPKTGRKHQLRRHLHHLHHHIVGDTKHGEGRHNRFFRENYQCHRLMLHASRLIFSHPITDERIILDAGIDETWLHVMKSFDWELSLLDL
ncbi:tRNA pseudouridine(65) synthase TruC [Vibrio sp. SS-MA-C1-2]|uniref:tRNA pseudouridine(65) synthase TruC n=1 Tax=Vibrio sp. SS-MA-C1-2 TaxID=2908646 RepID=UPI001F275F2E|nr:tRNA pseudouridine(65) synthase TruC [Vibrio sp. SS-MA-C1-2]UJF20187.1 tRNA pseudouridine(65) synthase TruC [Vibrio sp. SS-MA-C1-2]